MYYKDVLLLQQNVDRRGAVNADIDFPIWWRNFISSIAKLETPKESLTDYKAIIWYNLEENNELTYIRFLTKEGYTEFMLRWS
jgi:hypothetical protein